MPTPWLGQIDFRSVGDIIDIVSTGDLSGTKISALSVTAIKGIPSFTAVPAVGGLVVYDGNQILGAKPLGDVTGGYNSLAVIRLRGWNLLGTSISAAGQAIVFDGAQFVASALSTAGGTVSGFLVSLGQQTLSGAVNGSNTIFSLTSSTYIVGSSVLFLNGNKLDPTYYTISNESATTGGTFNFNTAPISGDKITGIYAGSTIIAPAGLFAAMAGDVTGTTTANVVTAIRGVTVDSALGASLSASEYVLQWDNTNSKIIGKELPIRFADGFLLMGA